MPDKVIYTEKLLQIEEVDCTHYFSRCCSSLLSSKFTQHLQITSVFCPFSSQYKNGFLLEENLKLHSKTLCGGLRPA